MGLVVLGLVNFGRFGWVGVYFGICVGRWGWCNIAFVGCVVCLFCIDLRGCLVLGDWLVLGWGGVGWGGFGLGVDVMFECLLFGFCVLGCLCWFGFCLGLGFRRWVLFCWVWWFFWF